MRFDYPTLRKEREGSGTRRWVAGIEPKSVVLMKSRLKVEYAVHYTEIPCSWLALLKMTTLRS